MHCSDRDSPHQRLSRAFLERWSSVLREYAVRYGAKVAGWWIDGCYAVPGYEYTEPMLKYYHDAIRAGNPDALIAFNNAVHSPIQNGLYWNAGGEVSRYEDFTAGESNNFGVAAPTSRWVTGPAGCDCNLQWCECASDPPLNATVQWHSLSFLGPQWGAPGACSCEGFQPNCSSHGCKPYSVRNLTDYTRAVNAVGGVLTVDLQLLRNGSMNREQVAFIAEAWRH